MKIGIIDDEKPARSELRYLIQNLEPKAEIVEMECGEEALELFTKETFDLLCIDINLGDINGATLAVTARKMFPAVEIVFATAYNNYAEKAFEVDSLYYLMKPFSMEKVDHMLNRYHSRHIQKIDESENQKVRESQKHKLSKLSLTMDKKIIMVEISSIVYIEAQNRICIIHTRNATYEDANPLTYFEKKLKQNGFFRIQKSYLINLNHMKEMFPWFNNTYGVRMEYFEDKILPVSRNQIKNLKEILGI